MKRLILAGIIIIMLSLTGCVQKYNFTDGQSDVAAEYMAGLLLKNDKNYKESLIDINEINQNNAVTQTAATPTPALQEAAATDEGTSGSSSVNEDSQGSGAASNDYTIAQVIGTKSFDISYSDYKLYSSYPEKETNPYFSLTAREGDQLLVVNFTVENVTDKKRTLDLSKNVDLNYQLDINVGTIYKPELTLLENDLQYIDISVDAKKKASALLVFEVSKDIDMKDINLIISKNDKTDIIEIK